MVLQSPKQKQEHRDFSSKQRFHEEKFDHCNHEWNDRRLNEEWKYKQWDNPFQHVILFTAACGLFIRRKTKFKACIFHDGNGDRLTTTTCEDFLQCVLI